MSVIAEERSMLVRTNQVRMNVPLVTEAFCPVVRAKWLCVLPQSAKNDDIIVLTFAAVTATHPKGPFHWLVVRVRRAPTKCVC